MPRKLLMLICLTLLTSFPELCFGQGKNLWNNKTIFALGEITTWPDSIYLFEKEAQIEKFQNYTKLERTKRNHFKIWFWNMKNGGIVDPANYKQELSITIKKSIAILKIGKNKKTYSVFPLVDKTGQKTLLVMYK